MSSARMNPFSMSLWMAPAAWRALVPRRIVHARHSSSPAVKNDSLPSRWYDARIMRSRAGDAMPSSARNASASARSRLRDLRLDLRGERDDLGVRPSGEVAEPERLGAEVELRRVGLVGVDHEEERLQGEKREAAQPLDLVVGEGEAAKRRLLLERGEAFLERRQVLLVLVLVGLLDRELQLLDALLGDRVIGQDQLGLHRGRIAGGVDRPFDVRDRLVLEGAHHVRQRIDGAELLER